MRLGFMKHRRLKLGGIVIAVVVSVYALIGFFVVPWVLKSRVLPQAAEKMGRSVTAEHIKFNPFTLCLTVDGFRIQDTDGAPLIGFEQLFVNFQTVSLFRLAFVFKEIRLAGPRVDLVIDNAGKVNLSGLVSPAEPEKESPKSEKAGIPAVIIDLLEVGRGRLAFKDLSGSSPFETTLSPISFHIDHFSTEPARQSPFQFAASFGDGAQLKWGGDFSVQPLRAKGGIEIDHVALQTWWTYFQDLLPFEIMDGRIDISLAYDVGIHEALQAELSAVRLNVSNLGMGIKNTRAPLIRLASAEVAESHFNLAEKKIAIGPVRFDTLQVSAERSKEGDVNLQALFAGNGAASADSPVPASDEKREPQPSSPWHISVPSVTLDNSEIVFLDQSLAEPVKMYLAPLKIEVSGYENTPDAKVNLSISSGLNETGSLQGTGTIGLSPLDMALDLVLEKLDLPTFTPYLKPVARVAVNSGRAGAKGHLIYNARKKEGAAYQFTGSAGIDDLSIEDSVHDEPILGWKRLFIEKISFQDGSKPIKIGRVDLDHLKAAYSLYPEGGSTVSAIVPEKSAPKDTSKKTEKSDSKSLAVLIDEFRLIDNAIVFTDRSISPHFGISLQALSGKATSIATAPVLTAALDFKGKIDGMSPFALKGRLLPPGKTTSIDIALDSKNIEMTRMTPYFGKYVGNAVQKGKLFLDLKYTVSGQQLKGENRILLDQFSLGNKTNSPDATSLPVGLAIALLKDRNGKIDIDLPVQGDMSDPEFSYGGLILKALVNLIAKAATSPFSLLGSLVGGDGEALQTIAFPFGETQMQPDEMEKLNKIGGILSERPGLGLEIKGTAALEKDRFALAEKRLAAMLIKMKTKEGAQSAPLTPEEEAEWIQKAYLKKFPEAPPVTGKTQEEILQIQKKQLLSAITVSNDELRALADERAGAIKTYLVNEAKISNDRLFLVDIALAEVSPSESASAALALVGK